MKPGKKTLYPLLALAIAFAVASLLLMNKPVPVGDDYRAPPPTVRTIVIESRSEHMMV